jgi:hypothetical protein
MFKARQSRRQRAKERARVDAIRAEATTAANAARQALREAHGLDLPGRLNEDAWGEAIQAAVMGSVLPSVVEALHQPTTTAHARRSAKGGSLLFLLGLGTGIGLAMWARRDDPPASLVSEDDEWELANGANARAAKEAINTTLERLDVALRRVVKVAADSMGSTVGVIADAAAPTAERVTDQLKVARRRATAEVIRALDDVDDVWGDDGDDADVAQAPPVRSRKPVARRPVEGKIPSAGRGSTTTRAQNPSGTTRRSPTTTPRKAKPTG